MSAFEWDRLSQPDFDKIVEALLLADNADLPEDAYAVNGRGGDEGVDIHMRRDGRLTIVQLKCFPEGFSGGFAKTRREQIRKSFESAMQHTPDEWWLVVPTTLTARERKFVMGLLQRRKATSKSPKIVVIGRPELDRLASKHPDLITYYKRDELREAARDYQQEQALLINKDDVLARVAALSKQTDTLHPDWRLGFFSDGDIVGTTLVPKHPKAAERSPITLTLNAKFGPDQEELRKAFAKAMSFGTPGRIDLPASVVSNFTVDGPEFIAENRENVEVSWIAKSREDTAGRAISLVFYNEADKPIGSFPGKTTWVNSASLGASVHATFYDTFEVELLLPFDQSSNVHFGSKIDMAGSSPSDIVRAVSLLEHLETASRIGIELDGKPVCRLVAQGRPDPFGQNREAILTHRAIAADLAVIQEVTARHFNYPEEVQFLDRVYARCLRLLLEGRCIVLPGHREVTPRLNGDDGEHIRQLLSGEPMSLIVELENFGQEIFGHQIYVGQARIYAPRVRAVDPGPALNALDAGTAAGYELTIRADEDYGFWVFLPGRYVEADDGRLRPASLGISDFADAADVARAQEPRDAAEG